MALKYVVSWKTFAEIPGLPLPSKCRGLFVYPCLINLEALSTLAFLSLGFLTGELEWMSPDFIALDRRRTTGIQPLQIELGTRFR